MERDISRGRPEVGLEGQDLVGRDPARVRELWRAVDAGGQFDLSSSAYFKAIASSGFVSDFSTHADRVATIRRVEKDYGVVVDTHTADGIKVGLAHREQGVPLICLETALPVKFSGTIREALGRDPARPAGYENIESLPQRVEVLDPDAGAVKRYIETHLD